MKPVQWLFFLLLIPVVSLAGGPDKVLRDVTAGFQSGDAAAVSNHFHTMVDLTLPGAEGTYSKAQASQILKDFLSRTPVKGFKVTRQGSSPDGSTYCIATLTSGSVSYRVYCLIKAVGGSHKVYQMQIQEQ